MEKWCEIIGMSEHTENSKLVLREPLWMATTVKDIQILLEREA